MSLLVSFMSDYGGFTCIFYMLNCVYIVCVCLCMHGITPCTCAQWNRELYTPMNVSMEADACGRRKRVLELLELESEEAVSCPNAGARNRTQVLCKGRKYS